MNNLWIKNSLRFVVVITFQLFVLNEIELHGFINPYLYPIIILLLPYSINRATLLLISFILGLIIDAYSGTLGMHAAACTFIGFIRPYILRYIQPRLGYEDIEELNDTRLSLAWFFAYATICIIIHHTIYFIIEVGNFKMFHLTLIRIIASTSISLLLIMMYRLILRVKKA